MDSMTTFFVLVLPMVLVALEQTCLAKMSLPKILHNIWLLPKNMTTRHSNAILPQLPITVEIMRTGTNALIATHAGPSSVN